MDVSALPRPHREITKTREGLGDQFRCRQGARKVGRWRLLAFPDNLTSVNWLTECLGCAGKLSQRQRVNILSTSEHVAFEQTLPPPLCPSFPVSTVNHTKIATLTKIG